MSTPQKREWPGATGQNANETTDARIVASAQKMGNDRASTLKAAFAVRGHAVHEAPDGFLVCRGGYVKHCPTLDDLERFARVVGAV